MEKSAEELLSTPLEEVLSGLGTSKLGLSTEEAGKRLGKFGHNELARKKKRAIVLEFLSKFKSPLLIILLIAGLISGFFGEMINAALIFMIVIISGVLEFYQEHKAEHAAEMLKEKVSTTATVMRGAVKREKKISEIVPGDVVLLSAGDMVPADARVISAKDLYANQSSLTGESFPVEKNAELLKQKSGAITEWSNCLFMGTSIVGGTGSAVVLKTGSATEYGKIAKSLVGRAPETEFDRGLKRFGYFIMKITFVLVLLVFLINALLNRGILESLLFALAIAVGITPELLPMIVSVNFSKAALEMSKKGVIVKRLAAIQNLGSMDVLCTDKTGTLTENKITLILHIDVEGKNDEKVLLYSFVNSYYQTGLKSPLDEAILRHEGMEAKDYEKLDEIPFDFVRKRVSVVAKHEGKNILITKGAPEEVGSVCSVYECAGKVSPLTKEMRGKIEKKYYELSAEGFRVLGISYKKENKDKTEYAVNDENEMIFLGFVAFIDPPKGSAKESLRLLKKGGVELKVITGDNELVTRKTCKELSFEIRGLVNGSELSQIPDDALSRVVENTNVFCRVTPMQKDRIIYALKRNNHVVGYLGDGINDAPSMKTADVGISVDNAVDVAKESADIILSRKSLRVLEEGVREGRKTFSNITKYINMATSSSFGNMFSVAGASLFLPFLPMLPIQILLNNLLYESSQLTIPVDNVDAEDIEKPKKLDVNQIGKFMVALGPISSLFDFITFAILLLVFSATPALFQTAWFIESLCTQALVIFAIRTKRSPFYKSSPSRLLVISTFTAVAIAFVLPFTPLGAVFKFVELPFSFVVLLAVLIATYIVLAEVVKNFFYKLNPA
ncbi:MAG: magnesium-translocating P-type ATPase [Candidatus Micrarchaeota archaeon]